MTNFTSNDTFFSSAEYCLKHGVYPDANLIAFLRGIDAERARVFADAAKKRLEKSFSDNLIDEDDFNTLYALLNDKPITRARKDISTLNEITSLYHDKIIDYIIEWFTGERRTQNAKGDFKKAATQAFGDAFDSGYIDGGGSLPPEEEDLGWYNARLDTEFGFIDQLFENMKGLKKEEGFDYFSWAGERATGYSQTVRMIYAEAKVRGAGNKMLTFDGDDGLESCTDCQKYKGKRHRARWWVSHNAVPPNRDFECHGYRCQHYLVDDDGNQWTGE
jgi:hypothetical protein